MEDRLLTPITRYELRSRTPNTPVMPVLTSTGNLTPSTPTRRSSRNKKLSTPSTPLRSPALGGTPGGTPGFNTPMAFKPRLVGNRPVPSPSRQEIWRQQLGLTDDPTQTESDKENTSDEEDEKASQTTAVEHRALQKVLADKDAKYNEVLLQMKGTKDKMRHYKSKFEREENMKRQQLKIMRKTHENQIHEKDQLIDNLQSLIQEHEERIQELEQTTQVTQHKRSSPQEKTGGLSGKLIEEIRRLQAEKSSLLQQASECQAELNVCREDSDQKISYLKCLVSQLESAKEKDGKEADANKNIGNLQFSVSSPCSTDTEKQVEVLQMENEKLLNELAEIKNAHTKAVTVGKLAAHRQQQLEEELKRVRAELETKSEMYTSVEMEKTESQVQTQQFQAEVYALYANKQKVTDVTAKAQSNLDAQRHEIESLQAHSTQLQHTFDEKSKLLTAAQEQVKYLEKVVTVTKSEKESIDKSLWKEMEDMAEEHKTKEQTLRQDLTREKEEAIKQIQDEILSKQMTEIDRLRLELDSEHQQEVSHLMSEAKVQREQSVVEVTQRLEAEREQSLQEIRRHLTEEGDQKIKELERKLDEEKKDALMELYQQLESQRTEELKQLQEDLSREREEALTNQRRDLAENHRDLQEKYEQLVEKLSKLNPILNQFVESYILLQKEVSSFPRVISKTISQVQKQVSSAIMGISELNKELTRKYQTEMKLRKKYHNELVEVKGNIRVFCRVRPVITEDGAGMQAENIVQLDEDDDGLLYVNSKQGRLQSFEVDKVFGKDSSQTQVFDEVKALVMSCIDGYNICIFAYGQTGSGKTYTMEGTRHDPGINQRALKELFAHTESMGKDWSYTITVSVIEIYNEMIRDLLADDTSYKMEVKMNPDGGLYIPGLTYITVTSVSHVNEWFSVGQKNRATAATNMNEHSSRSHALLCVTVTGVNHTTNAKTTGKLNLVDLAGSERVSKSKADGARLKEAQSINKSLSSLGDVINALRSKQSYVPYRNSKLTYMLQDSLGGDSKTLMITQVSPVRKNEGESICSLNFAQRVRNVELGAASRRFENGDLESDPSSPARSTPQRMAKLGTPLSASKLTPTLRQARGGRK